MAESIRLYIFAARGLTLDEFRRAYPDPVLVLSPFSSAEGTGSITRIMRANGQVNLVPFEVVRVKKRPGANPFKNMVTIGRADTNDLQVKAGEVSKFHAYLTLEAGDVSIVDAGSTNGTWVNDVALAPRTPRPLAPGDQVSLGGVLVTYHDPTSLYEFLRATVGAGEIEEA